uniref:Uncharacterized protein n=1 Tax=Candidatus Kentrum sp. LFY TaxID=2126342 RepID=A0A450WM08_9GAMM|nr:MAG: hypothetical protein BECKLFY1418C_GA0070996_103821 [Candidatus Kentron sp. LFY]
MTNGKSYASNGGSIRQNDTSDNKTNAHERNDLLFPTQNYKSPAFLTGTA